MKTQSRMLRLVLVLSLSLGALMPGSITGRGVYAQEPDPESHSPLDHQQLSHTTALSSTSSPALHPIHLKSRTFTPNNDESREFNSPEKSDQNRAHVLLQLDFIPRQATKEALAEQGIKLLAYVPDYT